MHTHSRDKGRPHRHLGRSLISRGVLFALLWLVLSGAAGDWPYGVLAVAATLVLSLILLPAGKAAPIPWWRVARLLPWFAFAALRAGFDVASRALRPGPPLDPDLVEVELTVGSGAQRIVLAYLITLLPGTLAAEFTDKGLRLHVLDRAMDSAGSTHTLARRLFGHGGG